MSRTYRDVPNGSYLSERQRIAEERRRQKSIDTAKQQSELLQKIEHEKEEHRQNDLMLFELWRTMDERLEELEHIRDELMPKDPNEQFSEELTEIILRIKALENLCNDLYFKWLNYDRPEFSNVI